MSTRPAGPIRIALLAAVALVGLTGCLAKSASTASDPLSPPSAAPGPATVLPPATDGAARILTVAPGPTTPPAPATARPVPGVHFATPEAAMRYLAAAYNRQDLAALRAVTTPAARAGLASMRAGAVNLRLDSCTANPGGDYTCRFTHDYPPGLHLTGHGHASVVVAPADRPGWYMASLSDCG